MFELDFIYIAAEKRFFILIKSQFENQIRDMYLEVTGDFDPETLNWEIFREKTIEGKLINRLLQSGIYPRTLRTSGQIY